MNNTDQLIASLSGQGTKKGKAKRPCSLLLLWMGGLALYVAVIFGAHLMPLRGDIATAVHTEPFFAAEIASLIALVLTSVWAAVFYAYPDCYQKSHIVGIPAKVAIVFIAILAVEWGGQTGVSPGPGIECLICISALSLLPAVFLFWHMRKMATVNPDIAGLLCSLCAFGLGALILRLSEDSDSIAHIAVWHYVPIFVISLLGFKIGPRLLKW